MWARGWRFSTPLPPTATSRTGEPWARPYCCPEASRYKVALQIRVDERRQLRLGDRAYLGRHNLAILEQHECRDAAHVIARGHRLILIDVHLSNGQAVAIGLRRLVEHGTDHLAGPAPLRPIVHEDRGR